MPTNISIFEDIFKVDLKRFLFYCGEGYFLFFCNFEGYVICLSLAIDVCCVFLFNYTVASHTCFRHRFSFRGLERSELIEMELEKGDSLIKMFFGLFYFRSCHSRIPKS